MFIDLTGEFCQFLPVLSVAIDRGPALLHLGQQMGCGRWRDPLRGEVTANIEISWVFLFLDSLMLLPGLLYLLLLRPAAFVQSTVPPFELGANPGNIFVCLRNERFSGG